MTYNRTIKTINCWWGKNLITCVFIFLFLLQASSQVSFIKRIELDIRDKFSNKKVIPIGKDGFIIQSLSTEVRDEHRILKLEHFDTSLNIQETIGGIQDFDNSMVPRIVLFETWDGRKGAIKIKEFVQDSANSHIVVDVKVQKQ